MNQRQIQQSEFEASSRNLVVGLAEQCPIPPEQLAQTMHSSPYVVQVFNSGLTAEVFRVRFDGKDYTLKKKRPQSKVQNLDGQFSFLNEIQRRADFQSRKENRITAQSFRNIVSTIYANYKLGIILSEWIEGEPVSKISPEFLSQLFSTLGECEKVGLFEWDLCGGNLLVDKGNKLWLFDFGYMYPFDPLQNFNSNGLDAPLFHFCERFETRFLFGWLLDQQTSLDDSLVIFKRVKQHALNTLITKKEWLKKNGAISEVINYNQQLIDKYQQALSDDSTLKDLYTLESFRSHVLDIEDDIEGKSCTTTTIKRVETVLLMIGDHYRLLKQLDGLFYHNEGKTQPELVNSYQDKLSLVRKYQL